MGKGLGAPRSPASRGRREGLWEAPHARLQPRAHSALDLGCAPWDRPSSPWAKPCPAAV